MTKLRKTTQEQRQHYIYESENGYTSVLFPGVCRQYMKDGTYFDIKDPSITPELIASLHSDDDKEVNSNLKYLNCETRKETNERIAKKKQWDIEHMDDDGIIHGDNPYERPQKLIRLNHNYRDDEDDESSNGKSKVEFEIACMSDYECIKNERIKAIRRYVFSDAFTEKMQRFYYYVYILGYTQAEYGSLFGLSKSTVSECKKVIEEKIIENFQNDPNF